MVDLKLGFILNYRAGSHIQNGGKRRFEFNVAQFLKMPRW